MWSRLPKINVKMTNAELSNESIKDNMLMTAICTGGYRGPRGPAPRWFWEKPWCNIYIADPADCITLYDQWGHIYMFVRLSISLRLVNYCSATLKNNCWQIVSACGLKRVLKLSPCAVYVLGQRWKYTSSFDVLWCIDSYFNLYSSSTQLCSSNYIE